MKKLFCWISMMGLAMVGTGCATPRVDITSEPSRAAVSVDHEYIGKTPVTHKIKDDPDTLVITIEKLCYESEMRRLEKKGGGWLGSGKFPEKVHFILQPSDCEK